MDIIKDSAFAEANTVFQAEISELKREGKAQTQHKPPISSDDIKKLYQERAVQFNSARNTAE